MLVSQLKKEKDASSVDARQLKNLKIAMVTGSYPPDACGVGDYTACLVKELRSSGITVQVITHDGWHLKNTIAIARKIHSIKPDIIHIQHPTVGYAEGVAPQMICLLFPCVVTLHEISEVYTKGKLALVPFLIHSRHLIITSSYERAYILRWFPWLARRCNVIPIGSNIPVGRSTGKRDIKEIIFFGLLHPYRGLEEILQFASLVKQASLPFCVRIVGKVQPFYRQYFETIHRQSKLLPIEWSIGLSADAVSKLLARARFAYMPFPGGATERRTSLLALLANGVITITTVGKHTPPELKAAVVVAQDPKSALQRIRDIMSDRSYQLQMYKKGRIYAKNFSWDVIAKKHCEVYNTTLAWKTK